MSCNINFFQEIENLRRSKGISINSLCADIMSERTYYRYLSGELNVKLGTLETLLERLNISIIELIIKSRFDNTSRDPGLNLYVYKLYTNSIEDARQLYLKLQKYRDEDLLVQRFIDANLYKFRYITGDISNGTYSKLLKKILSDLYYVEDTNIYKLYIRSEYILLDYKAREVNKLGELIKTNDFCMAPYFSIIVMDNYLNVAIKKQTVSLDEMKRLYKMFRSMLKNFYLIRPFNKLDLYRAYIEKYCNNEIIEKKYLIKYINGIMITDEAKVIRNEFKELEKDFGIQYLDFLNEYKSMMFNGADSRFRVVKKVSYE